MGPRLLVAAVCADAVSHAGHRRDPPQPHAPAHVARALGQPGHGFLDHVAAGTPHLRVLSGARGQPPSLQARSGRPGAHLSLRRRHQSSVGLPDPSGAGGLGAVSAVLHLAGPAAPALARRLALLHGAVRRLAGPVGGSAGAESGQGAGVRDRAAAARPALAAGHQLPAARARRWRSRTRRGAELCAQFRGPAQSAAVQHRPAHRASRAFARALGRADRAALRPLPRSSSRRAE